LFIVLTLYFVKNQIHVLLIVLIKSIYLINLCCGLDKFLSYFS